MLNELHFDLNLSVCSFWEDEFGSFRVERERGYVKSMQETEERESG